MLEESVIYQDIFQKGEQRGEQRERNLVLRQLERLLGQLSARTRKQIETLSIEQVEALGEALLEFKGGKSLTIWLKQHAAKS